MERKCGGVVPRTVGIDILMELEANRGNSFLLKEIEYALQAEFKWIWAFERNTVMTDRSQQLGETENLTEDAEV